MRPLETLYEETRRRIAGVVTADREDVAGATDAAAVAVPACPEWSVRDVVSHLTGICADVLAGNVVGAATDEWTAAQVDARRSMALPEILAEWNDVGAKLAALVDDIPAPYGHQIVADLAVHEHDIRGALGRPGARDSGAMQVGIEFLVSVIAQPEAAAAGLPPIDVRAGDRAWVLGKDGDPIGSLTVEPFQLFRSFTGRRSAAQIRGLDWSVDPEPYLALFGLGPFTMREASLVE